MARHKLPDDAYEAQRIAIEMRAAKAEVADIVNRLNRELEGCYYHRKGTIYRRNEPDYLPELHILEIDP